MRAGHVAEVGDLNALQASAEDELDALVEDRRDIGHGEVS